MYKITIFIILVLMLLSIQFFNSKQGVVYKTNSLISDELGNNSDYVELQTPIDRIIALFGPDKYSFPNKGFLILNDLRVGYYVTDESSPSKKDLTLLNNNTAKLVYTSSKIDKIIYEVGFWRSVESGNIELRIIGSQFGTYKTPKNFIFEVQDDGKKIFSSEYDNSFYSDRDFIFYKK